MILLVAPDLVNMNDNDLTGELLLLGSSLSYAIGNIYAKRNVKGLAPRIPALFQVFLAMLVIVPAALVIDRPLATVQPAPEAILAIVWLGIVGSGLAYICYFTILANWGATRTSLVAYLLPVVGILLGSAILDDPLTAQPDRRHGARHRRHRARQQWPGLPAVRGRASGANHPRKRARLGG